MGIIELAAAAGIFAVGAGAGLLLAHFLLHYRRAEFDKAMERAEFLLKHDAVASARELETSLAQLATASEATRSANDRARAAEARVASLSQAFRTLRSDPTISRISMRGAQARPKLAPKVEPAPATSQHTAPRNAETVIIAES